MTQVNNHFYYLLQIDFPIQIRLFPSSAVREHASNPRQVDLDHEHRYNRPQ